MMHIILSLTQYALVIFTIQRKEVNNYGILAKDLRILLTVHYFIFQDRSNATSSCAGLFIAAHLGFDFPGNWIHVDMAYPVHCVSI